MILSHFLNFLVGYESGTYILAFLRRFESLSDTEMGFEHFLGWYETRLCSLTHLVAILDLEVIISQFLNFLVGYELRTYTQALLDRFESSSDT